MSASVIVFEGLDGVGKTSLSKRVATLLGAQWMSTPDTALRSARATIDEVMCDAPIALQLFYAATVSWASTRARSLVATGTSVVIDRYWASTAVYASLRGRSVTLDDVRATLLRATLTVWVDVNEDVRCERLRQRGATAADNATLLQGRALREAYARTLSDELHGTVLIIDNSAPLDVAANTILAAISRRAAA